MESSTIGPEIPENSIKKKVSSGDVVRIEETSNSVGDSNNEQPGVSVKNIERIMYIGAESRFWSAGEQKICWENVDKLAEGPVTHLVVSDLQNAVVPNYVSPHQLREIHFFGQISQATFDKLIFPLENLVNLEVHVSTLEYLWLKLGTSKLNLPLLEVFQISSMGFTLGEAKKSNIVKIMENSICLIEKKYPNLNFLSISLPLISAKEKDLIQAILKAVGNHRKTLRYLNIVHEIFLDLDDNCNIKASKGTKGENTFDVNIGLAEEAILGSFHFYTLKPSGSIDIWRKFLKTQLNLKYCQIWCVEDYLKFPAKIISKNKETLEKFAAQISTWDEEGKNFKPIDCSVFGECVKLKVLALSGSPDKAPNPNRIPELMNLHKVPAGLTSVKISNLLIGKNDIATLVTNNPNLSGLYLEGIGEEGDLGIGIDTLAGLLETQTEANALEQIEIVEGFNKESLFKKDESEDGYRILAKMLLRKNDSPSFRAYLTEDGDYDLFQNYYIAEDSDDDGFYYTTTGSEDEAEGEGEDSDDPNNADIASIANEIEESQASPISIFSVD